MKRFFFLGLIATTALTSCDEAADIIDEIYNGELTESVVVNGLKEALEIGVDSAASGLSITNGYYADELVKIGLPSEADIIVENISYIPGGSALVEKVILSINRAAEDAASEVAPVFWDAITDMSILDGFEILNGDNDAATQYLKSSTYDDLFELYQPKIQTSLDKDIIGGITANDAWENLTTPWNNFASSLSGQLLNFETVNTSLDEYLTNKALDGLFLKLAGEEEKIRTDPAAQVTDLLQKVFGSL
ncbi:DUF4197 domain-containing protein [Geofilum sp. OHC36d9]|uniref:DUF4197 domain-containing protein n=1 Tax=Geofilum sp. OHC36d9 TaxID=3458413 RepID=UPI0040335110